MGAGPLPAPTVEHYKQFWVGSGGGSQTILYVCLRDAGGNYYWEQVSATSPSTVDHSALINLNADDHIQYHTDGRGDIRYYLKTQLQTSGQASVHWDNITNKPSAGTNVYVSTVALLSERGTSETIIHNLNNVDPMITTKFQPTSGFYSGSWVSGEGVITVMFIDANTVRIYNDSKADIPIGNVKIIILR